MKVQIFVPPQGYVAQRWDMGSSMPPLGVLYLAAALEQNSIEVDVVPADILGYSWSQVEARIRDFNPDMVGVTTTTENRFDSFELVKRAKKVNPEILTVLGGPHISMAGRETLEYISHADVLAVGEGERTIVELAEALAGNRDLSRVSGIYYRDSKGGIRFTGPRKFIENLDELPLPARHMIPIEKYNFYVTTRDGRRRKAQNIMTSRGCPFNCYFCATPVNWGRKVRGRSPEKVVEEIEFLISEYDAEFIWFYDDTLNYNVPRLHRIMDLIIERRLDIKFNNEFRIDLVDKPLLEKMCRAGLENGYFGIEAGASRVRQDVVQKHFEIDLAFQFAEWSRELDFVPGPFFIFSHYTETWSEARETIRIMNRIREINPQVDISTAILHVYPGSPLEAIAKKAGIVPKDFIWSKKSDMKRVYTMPAAQGYVPLFKHKLSWWQIATLVMRFSSTSKKKISWAKIKKIIKSLNNIKNFKLYFSFTLVFLKYRLESLLRIKKQ